MGELYRKERCKYCGKEITKDNVSKEHIIHNALGGTYVSKKICCSECNNIIGKKIDVPFAKNFNWIDSRIGNFTKEDKKIKKSNPKYEGKILIDGKEYDAYLKGGRITSVPEFQMLKKQLNLNLEEYGKIVSYKTQIDDESFKRGLRKIAFNFAIDRGIEYAIIEDGIRKVIFDGNLQDVEFEYPIIPYVPLDQLDFSIELIAPFEMYHYLYLFDVRNCLICYIDLFGAFQNYVILSENYHGGPVEEYYFQRIPEKSAIKDNDSYKMEFTEFLSCKFNYAVISLFYKIKYEKELKKLLRDVEELSDNNEKIDKINFYLSEIGDLKKLPDINKDNYDLLISDKNGFQIYNYKKYKINNGILRPYFEIIYYKLAKSMEEKNKEFSDNIMHYNEFHLTLLNSLLMKKRNYE